MKLRVLMVSANYLPVSGGVETHIAQVAPRLRAAGVEIGILTTDRSNALPHRELIDGIPVRRVRAWPARRDWYLAPGLSREIRRIRWDVIHCQGIHTLVPPLAMVTAASRGIPYVVTLHSGGHSSVLRQRLRLAQWMALAPLLRGAGRIIAVSSFEADSFARVPGLDASRISVIPSGSELGVRPGSLPEVEPGLIVSVGRLERYKGHHRVIAALPGLGRSRPGIRLRIVGSGPYEDALRAVAEASGVGDRVEIAPIAARDRSGMADALARAAAVVLLSEYESQGLALTEAVALGRPVVATDASAMHQLVERGAAIPVRPRASTQEVEAAILTALAAPPPSAGLALPTWDDCASALLQVYERVLEEAGSDG